MTPGDQIALWMRNSTVLGFTLVCTMCEISINDFDQLQLQFVVSDTDGCRRSFSVVTFVLPSARRVPVQVPSRFLVATPERVVNSHPLPS